MNEKIEELKKKGMETYEKVMQKAKENKEVLIVFGPVAIGAMVEIGKAMNRSSTMRTNKRLRENYVYDRSAGHYYETKRKLKNKEWLQFDERRDQGEPVGRILNDMGLLKR